MRFVFELMVSQQPVWLSFNLSYDELCLWYFILTSVASFTNDLMVLYFITYYMSVGECNFTLKLPVE